MKVDVTKYNKLIICILNIGINFLVYLNKMKYLCIYVKIKLFRYSRFKLDTLVDFNDFFYRS